GPGTHQSYGSGWANLGNTPLRLYKHFTHEGGIATPFIAHWPAGIGTWPDWIRRPAHVMDLMPTLLAAAGAAYPMTLDDTKRLPIEGRNLLPIMRGGKLADRTIGFDHQGARALRRGDWKIVWGKRMPTKATWELYNLSRDRCEVNDVANRHPERVEAMVKEWETWARRVGVIWDGPKKVVGTNDDESPGIANQPLSISGKVVARGKKGVIAAQGGNQHGWAVHLLNGRLAFDVRVKGKVSRIVAQAEAPDQFTFEAGLTADTMTLTLDGRAVAKGPSPGLIPVQPIDALSIGRDDRTAAGNYQAPNPLNGKVTDLNVKSTKLNKERFGGTINDKIRFPGGRIAYSADGNAHDKDDWAASPVGLLLLDMVGLKKQLVHYEFSNHLGDSKPAYEKEMVLSTVEAAKKIGGFDISVFYDCQKDLAGAVENLASEINKSSAD
ncbi:MAG: hypothetical protein AAF492_25255, partial [Verrucomicrobiota bacterium]